MANKRSSSLSSKIGGTLFGGAFFAFGFGFFIAFVGSSLADWVEMRNWHPVQAQLLSTKLERNYSDGSTTYKATASYDFDYRGQRYQGDRVSIHTGSDNIGSYQENMNTSLKRAKSANRPVTAWVNPNNPYESVIDRELRFSMIIFPGMLCSVFMIIGGVIVYYSWKKPKTPDPVTVSDTPWQAKPEWSPTGIDSNNRLVFWLWWGGALFINTISSPILFQMPSELSKGNYGILFGLIFVALGMLVLIKAIHKTLEQQRFGRVPVILTPFPGEIGGKVAGHIDFQQRLDTKAIFSVTLKQMRTTISRSGGKTSTSTSCIWDLKTKGSLKSGINGSRVYFSFAIPAGMEPSKTDDGSGYWWSLEVHGDMPGVDFKRSYEIPVFDTGKTSEVSQPSDVATAKSQQDFSAQLEAMLDIQQLADGLLIRQPPGKQKMAIPMVIFGILFGGSGIGAGIAGAPLIFPIVFGAFGLLFVIWGIQMLITGYETYIDDTGVSHKIFRLGKESKQLIWSRAELRGFSLFQSGSSSSGTKMVEYFDLLLQKADGEKINISRGIAGRQAAMQLVESLTLLTGIPFNKQYKSRLQIKKEQMGRH